MKNSNFRRTRNSGEIKTSAEIKPKPENVRFHALNPRRTDVVDVTGVMAMGEGSRAAAAKSLISTAMHSHTDDLESDDEAARKLEYLNLLHCNK